MKSGADYEAWNTSMAAAEAGQITPTYPWHETVLKIVPDLNGKTVLEVGCGRGDFALLLARLYPSARIVATDFSETAINNGKSKMQPNSNVAFKIADAHALPFDELLV